MEEKEGEPGTLGTPASTVRVSSEVVRSNTTPTLTEWARALVAGLGEEAADGATVAMRQMDHIVTTGEGTKLSDLGLEDFVEVVDYDPVRHVAMVIGPRDAPGSIPFLWLMLRVFPGAEGVVVLPNHRAGEPRRLRSAPKGSFDEAFAAGEQMAGHGREGILGPAIGTFEGVGTLVVVPPGGDPLGVLDLSDDLPGTGAPLS